VEQRSLIPVTALKQDEDGEKTATVFFLGSPMQIEAANVLVTRAAVAMAHDISRAFSAVLHKEDVDRDLAQCRAKLAALVRSHLLPIAEQMKLSTAEVEQVLAHRVTPCPAK
jgi:hypothetical protein